jgi:glycerol uptake facilitator protein
MSQLAAEALGTCLLILLGEGVVANVVLSRTKGHGSGWIVITAAWGLAVFVAVGAVAPVSGAHINPAVTVSLAAGGKFPWAQVPGYVMAQLLGAALGAALVWVAYRGHFAATEDADAKLAVFCTAPAIRSPLDNLASEVLGTLVLTVAVHLLAAPSVGLGALDALPIGLVVFSIGLSLGGTTGYAINPARDLAPRIVHAVLPIPGKRDADWSYAWIPVVGPLLGGLLAPLLLAVLSVS